MPALATRWLPSWPRIETARKEEERREEDAREEEQWKAFLRAGTMPVRFSFVIYTSVKSHAPRSAPPRACPRILYKDASLYCARLGRIRRRFHRERHDPTHKRCLTQHACDNMAENVYSRSTVRISFLRAAQDDSEIDSQFLRSLFLVHFN